MATRTFCDLCGKEALNVMRLETPIASVSDPYRTFPGFDICEEHARPFHEARQRMERERSDRTKMDYASAYKLAEDGKIHRVPSPDEEKAAMVAEELNR